MPKIKKPVKKEVQPKIVEKVRLELAVGEKAITAEKAKQLLEWIVEPKGGKWGDKFLTRDADNKKVRCLKDVRNRPFYPAKSVELRQDILLGRWRFNGETIVIDCKGQIQDGQHTLIAEVMAAQIWAKDPSKWPFWKTEPTIDKIIVYGINDDDDTVNTLNTCRSRSVSDVIYRTEYFSDLSPERRVAYSTACQVAVRLLWKRTGVGKGSLHLKPTIPESLELLKRHPKLIECVQHIMEEDGNKKSLSQYLPLGDAAALMYLMGCSGSETTPYLSAEAPNEALLTWDKLDLARSFFTLLAAGDPKLKALTKATAQIVEETGDHPSNAERRGLIVNAWNAFQEDTPLTLECLELQYDTTEEGFKHLTEQPSLGGIDNPEWDESLILEKDPTEEEIQKRAEEARTKRKANKQTKEPKKPTKVHNYKPRKLGEEWQKNDVAWVRSPDGKHYVARLVDEPYECDDGDPRVMVTDNEGGEWEVLLKGLSLTEPKPIEKSSPTPAKANKAKLYKVGGKVWINPKNGEPWQGTVVEINPTLKVAKVRIETGFQGAGQVEVVRIADLSLEQPIAG